MRKFLITALKGFGMGAANVVPGVSGGTIALITGIYGKIIDCLNSILTPSKWKTLDWGFLISLGVGVLVSVFSLAKLVTVCLEKFPIQTWSFFFGLILVSAVFMLSSIKVWKVKDAALAVAGVVIGVTICTLSPTETTDSLWFIFVCGILGICSMILPGLSGSFILLVLGKYDYIMNAVSNIDWPVLIVFGLGCGIGIIAFAKLLHWMLARYERQTMLVLIGFVIGSLVKIWPWQEGNGFVAGGEAHIGGAILWVLIGIALLAFIESLSRNKVEK